MVLMQYTRSHFIKGDGASVHAHARTARAVCGADSERARRARPRARVRPCSDRSGLPSGRHGVDPRAGREAITHRPSHRQLLDSAMSDVS
eukprot:scaffold13787_cov145-Isochrysis_galbana.AAC.7